VILNTNNLPDGELDSERYLLKSFFVDFLLANSFFLAFRKKALAHINDH
jgi:hypothetical protein